VVAEQGASASPSLVNDIERKIRAVLTVPAKVELVAAGTLPRYEMKAQLIRKDYEHKIPDLVAGR
jgi:phenylacetate-coenzyme A ligase PaaK-like adenylate-forming protein